MQRDAIIIYLDLAGYSKNNELIQVDFFNSFQQEIHYVLYQEINSPQKNVILIPTGDGMIIGLLVAEDGSSKVEAAFKLVVRIFQWTANNESAIRCSLHSGSVNTLRDINRQDNIIGNSVNDAERMLSGADVNTIVISKTFFDKYIRRPDWEFNTDYRLANSPYNYRILDEDYIHDKHNQVHRVLTVAIRKNGEVFGEKGQLLTRYFSRMFSHEYSKIANLRESFLPKIQLAQEIDLFGIFHPNTPKILENIQASSAKRVNVRVYYAADGLADEITKFFESESSNLKLSTKKSSLSAITQWIEQHESKSFIALRIYEYVDIPSFGASAIDINDSGNGFIHISNYLRGVAPEETPYVELYWKTRTKPPLYDFYLNYLRDRVLGKGNIIYQRIYGK
jgi:hypothetical protein